MKKHILRIAIFALVFSFVLSPMAALAAQGEDTVTPRSSYYISATYASISGGSGSITVDFDITAKRPMTTIGATKVEICNSSGTVVKTFYSSSTSGMLSSGRSYYASDVTWNYATSGKKYYAIVYFKAGDSTGSDTATYVTGYATA